jgi:uncharacterized membrane protein
MGLVWSVGSTRVLVVSCGERAARKLILTQLKFGMTALVAVTVFNSKLILKSEETD